MERRELERRFMVENLVVGDQKENERRATELEVEEAIEEIFGKIGFHLTRPLLAIISYGYMPDEQSGEEQRYWATFQVDPTSALEIWEQQKGIKGRIETWNQKTWGGESHQKAKWLDLKKYQGTRFEATMRTLEVVERMLSESEYLKMDGFRLDVHNNEEIRLFFENKFNRKFTVEQLYEEHTDVFMKAIQTLPEEQRDSMMELVDKIYRMPCRKRHHHPTPHHHHHANVTFTIDDTVSSAFADDETTPPQRKMAHLDTPIPKKMMRMAEREVSPSMPNGLKNKED